MYKLPLYGPLDIRNHKAFLEEAKKGFFKRLKTVFHSDVSLDSFEMIATLGRGAFGTVKLVKMNERDEYFAAKRQLKEKIIDNRSTHRVYLEKRVLCSIDFPFCVRMEHYCHDKEAIYFLMPFVRGGELYTLIKKFGFFTSHMARFYAAQVVLALEFFQYIHYVYRDLKPENILLDHTGFLKITDFGLVKEVDSRTYTVCGTPTYMAPEVVEGNGYARSVDWWSLGVLIYEMTSGKPPFMAKDSIKLFTKIVYAPVTMYPFFSPNLKSLLRGLLNKDVTNRLGNLKNGADDVKKHPWFQKIDWLELLNRKTQPPYIPETEGSADFSNFPYAVKTLPSVKRKGSTTIKRLSKRLLPKKKSSDSIKVSTAGSQRQEVIDHKTRQKKHPDRHLDEEDSMSASFLEFIE